MESTKEKEGGPAIALADGLSSSQLATPRAPSPAPSTTSSTGRPPYMPQFSVATQMILKRINAKPGSLSSALSSASSTMSKTSIEKSTFEDAKRRLVMTMNTSLTMPLPTPIPTTKPKNSSATQKASANTMRMPMNDAFQLRTPAPAPASAKTLPLPLPLPLPVPPANQASQIAPAQKPKSKAPRGHKRKRGKENDDDNDNTSTSLSDLASDSEGDAAGADGSAAAASAKDQAAPMMTKSGRQVQRPAPYNPAQQSARDLSQKRKHYGKRTQEQALCKVCQRGRSPASNQIVFCDGCNNCWHQMCHDPYIDDDFVSNESRSWFCGRCLAKREKHLVKKKTLESYKGVGWNGKSDEQKRNYLSGVPHTQLVNIIMYSTELHPDLPIFPAHEPRRGGAQGAYRSSYDSPRNKMDAPSNVGPTHYSSKVSTPDSHSLNSKPGAKASGADGQDQGARESSTDSVPPAWPKVGMGCMMGLEMDEDDLRDDNDYEAFSVTTYDTKGKKIMENGKPV
ncbi:hypothetical protein GGR54DRAFT_617270 [Hypoxylon sp. NC1633]|nr:hypothetical protein GGR54DRAFT_617270 [Hypoxylon sp. NC1633]